jgi:hypothetical protein
MSSVVFRDSLVHFVGIHDGSMDNQSNFHDVAVGSRHIVLFIQDITRSDASLFRSENVAMTILVLVNEMIELSTLRVNHSEVVGQDSLSIHFLEEGDHFRVSIELDTGASLHDGLPHHEVSAGESVPRVMDANRMHLALTLDFLDHLIREVERSVKHILEIAGMRDKRSLEGIASDLGIAEIQTVASHRAGFHDDQLITPQDGSRGGRNGKLMDIRLGELPIGREESLGALGDSRLPLRFRHILANSAVLEHWVSLGYVSYYTHAKAKSTVESTAHGRQGAPLSPCFFNWHFCVERFNPVTIRSHVIHDGNNSNGIVSVDIKCRLTRMPVLTDMA